MTAIKVETRTKVQLGGRTRMTVAEATVPEHLLLDVIRDTRVDATRECTWPDGHTETFGWNHALQLVGPGDSRLLPGYLRHEFAKWYVESGRIYQIAGNQVTKLAEVPRAA